MATARATQVADSRSAATDGDDSVAAPSPGRLRWVPIVLPIAAPWAALIIGRWATPQGHAAFASYCTVVNLVLLSTLLATTVTDLRHGLLPNWIVYPAFLWLSVFTIHAAMFGDPTGGYFGTRTIADAALGAAACFGIMLFVFLCRGGGGGDVKLAAVLGVGLGLRMGLTALVLLHVVAGAAGLCWAIWTFGPIAVGRALGRAFGSLIAPGRIAPPNVEDRRFLQFPLPLSPFFLIAVVITLWSAAR